MILTHFSHPLSLRFSHNLLFTRGHSRIIYSFFLLYVYLCLHLYVYIYMYIYMHMYQRVPVQPIIIRTLSLGYPSDILVCLSGSVIEAPRERKIVRLPVVTSLSWHTRVWQRRKHARTLIIRKGKRKIKIVQERNRRRKVRNEACIINVAQRRVSLSRSLSARKKGSFWDVVSRGFIKRIVSLRAIRKKRWVIAAWSWFDGKGNIATHENVMRQPGLQIMFLLRVEQALRECRTKHVVERARRRKTLCILFAGALRLLRKPLLAFLFSPLLSFFFSYSFSFFQWFFWLRRAVTSHEIAKIGAAPFEHLRPKSLSHPRNANRDNHRNLVIDEEKLQLV